MVLSSRFLRHCAAVAALPVALAAQQPDAARLKADSSLMACLAAAPGSASAGDLASRAERAWRAEVSRAASDPAAQVGLARVLVQCQLPTASMTAQAALFEESVGLLQRAIALNPVFWPARFTLGLVFAGAPEFLGQRANAIHELERATAKDGIPEHLPELAVALSTLSALYQQEGRATDADRVRARGAALFPRDSRFGAPPVTPDSPAAPPVAPPAASPAPAVGSLQRVVVSAAAPDAARRRGGHSVSSMDVVTSPGGTADLQQALQTLPGVTGGSESGDLVLRGGDPEESPLYLNGARLAYAGKFESLNGGLFGALDPSVLRSARIAAGAFSARFGDALSGVIETQALGQPGGRTWRAGINTTGVSGTIARPIGKATGGWASMRATHTGMLLRFQDRAREFGAAPRSLEGMASVVRTLANGELQGLVLLEHDAASPYITAGGHHGAYEAVGTTASGVVSAALTSIGPFASVRLNSAVSSRQSGLAFGALDRSRTLQRVGVRGEVEWIAGMATLVRAGIEASHVSENLRGAVPATGSFAPGSPTATYGGAPRSTRHVGGYAEALVTATEWLSITPGARVDWLPGESSATLDPRLQLSARHGAWSFVLAGGVFQQGRFRSTQDQPGDDARTGVPRRADHILLGIEHAGRTTARADFYVKQYGRWVGGEPEFTPTSGRVVGADLFVNVPGTRRSGRVTYSLARGSLSLRDGSSLATKHDVTHSVVAIGSQRLARNWELGATARLSTGRPYTATQAVPGPADAGSAIAAALGRPFDERFPPYARVDARLSRFISVGQRLWVLYAEALNLGNRGNVAAYGYDADFRTRTPIRTFFGRRTVVLGAEVRR